MDIYNLISELRDNNIVVALDGTDLQLSFEDNEIKADVLDRIRENKQELVSYLQKYSSETQYEAIPALPAASHYPISDAQRRLWVLSQFRAGSLAYNLPGSVDLKGDYDIESFSKAIDATIDRHEMLRTVFQEDENGDLYQCIRSREELGFAIAYEDLRAKENQDRLIEEYIKKDNAKGFDLAKGPMLRATLLQLDEAHYVFYCNMHHIISDGWSMGVLVRDVLAYYDHYRLGATIGLPELRIHYKDYAAWQLALLENPAIETHKNYWIQQLSGALPVLDLPGQKLRPRLKTNNGQTLETHISVAATNSLKAFSQEKGGSLFMTLLALWKVLFYRYTGLTDIIIGSPVAGRNHPDLEDQIGFYVNTLALRTQIDPLDRFSAFYEKVKQSTFEAYDHQVYPFDRLVDDLGLKRDTSRSAVFDVMIILQNAGERNGDFVLDSKDVDSIYDKKVDGSRFDLEITFEEKGALLSLQINYNSDIYERSLIESLIRHFKSLMEVLLTSDLQVGKAEFLLQEEKKQLLHSFNNTETNYLDITVSELLEQQVEKTKDAVAVLFEDQIYTYEQINQRSNQLAQYLKKEAKVGTSDAVGVMLNRSVESVIAMIAVIKSGACYVPLDHNYPSSRIAYILEDAQINPIITQTELLDVHPLMDTRIIDLKKIDLEGCSIKNPEPSNQLTDRSFVVYTSGSTGKPKGVVQTHLMLSNLIQWDMYHSGIPTGLRHLQYASFSFDASLHDIYFTLCSGGSVYIVNDTIRMDYPLLKEEILAKQLQVLSFPFSALSAFFNQIELKELEGHAIQYLVSTAEQLYVGGNLATFLDTYPTVEIHNHYGPSETHVVTSHSMSVQKGTIENRSSIGKPISNTEIYIFDSFMNLVPLGAIGEIYIGGANLAIAYLNLPEESQKRFVEHPYRKGDKLYKTGDQAYWQKDGTIQFLGRKDDQVKIRGYRVELGEIERNLVKHHDIEEAVVLLREQELVAYFISSEEQNLLGLRSFLKQSLPGYMLPAHFLQLDAFPLTPNGKVDKRALLASELNGIASGVVYVAPRNTTEQKLALIWQKHLKKEPIGIKDDFFELGGHSIAATKLVSAYHKAFDVRLGLQDLFIHSTLEEQARLIQSSQKASYQKIPRVDRADSYPVSDAQRMIWVLSQFKEGSMSYVMPTIRKVDRAYDVEVLEQALYALMDRHETLRTVFRQEESGEIRQVILSRKELNFKFDYQDISHLEDPESYIEELVVEKDYQEPFDLERGPLFRAGFFQLAESSYVFYFTFHHIITDAWSVNIMTRDLMKLYEALEAGKEPDLPPLAIQYKDYAAWQQSEANRAQNKLHRNYWKSQFSDDLPVLTLPFQKLRPKVKTYTGRYLSTFLSKETTDRLKAFSQKHGGSSFMTLLAAWNILFHRYTGAKDIIIGSPVSGRDHQDLEDQIGCFVNTIVLRNQINPEDNFVAFYKQLKARTIQAYGHQSYPFERVIDDLDIQRDLGRNPIFDVMLVDQGVGDMYAGDVFEETELDDSIVNVIEDLGMRAVKFDLELHFYQLGAYTNFRLKFNTKLYEREQIDIMINHFKYLLEILLRQPDQSIGKASYLTPKMKEQVLYDFNNTKKDYPDNTTVLELFQQRLKKAPSATAIVFKQQSLSYQALDQTTNQLADYLKTDFQVDIGDMVALKLERSEWLPIAILGVLKAGAAYVPVDPSYPAQRTEEILTDSECKLCIDQQEIEQFISKQSNYSKKYESPEIHPDQLAYAIYTSGSTGKPKGVLNHHAGLLNRLLWMRDDLEIDHTDILFQKTPYTFDVSVWEFIMPLITGAKLVVAEPNGHTNPNYLQDLISKQKITIIHFVPSMLDAFLLELDPAKCTSLKHIVCSGEALSANTIEKLKGKLPHVNIHNLYGPTEAAIDVSSINLTNVDTSEKEVTIGRPVANTRLYILDDAMQPQGVGIPGELMIGGIQVARGYLNRPELNAAKFIKNPFVEKGNLYKTGDIAAWLPDGTIRFLGRKDNQVKVRGNRIELGEIEHCLRQKSELSQVVVDVKETSAGHKELVAYFTSDVSMVPSELRAFLADRLPSYLLPNYYLQLDHLPLTTSGKVDRKMLPSPEQQEVVSEIAYRAPRTKAESLLIKVWGEVLNRKGIGIDDNFFNLGGDSIKSIQVVARIKQSGYSLSIEEILRNPVLADLATYVVQGVRAIDQSSVEGEVSLIPIQQAFFRNHLIPAKHHYNQSVLLAARRPIDPNALDASLMALVKHHDALRMVYELQSNGNWKQFNRPFAEDANLLYSVKLYDLREEADEVEALGRLGQDLQSSFDLTNGPLLKVGHFKMKNEEYLALIIHHLVIDGVSWRILLEDLSFLYDQYIQGEQSALPLKTDSFQRWAALQEEFTQSSQLAQQRPYWESLGQKQVAVLPVDYGEPEEGTQLNTKVSFTLDKGTTELLLSKANRVYNTEINDLLLAGLGLAIKDIFEVDEVLLKMEGHGREDIFEEVDVSRTVGWFTTIFPFLLDLTDTENPERYLVKVKEALRQIPDKGIAYGILKELSSDGLPERTRPSIMFNYLGDFGNETESSTQSAFQYASGFIGHGYASSLRHDVLLDISGMQVGGAITMNIAYSNSVFQDHRMEVLSAAYQEHLCQLIQSLAENDNQYLSPSDLTYKGLTVDQLESINSDQNVQDVYILSPLQEGLYYHWLSEAASSLYFMQISYQLRSADMNIDHVKEAFDQLIARHDVLRTSFTHTHADAILQVVHKDVSSRFSYIQLPEGKELEDPSKYIKQIKLEDRAEGFDLHVPSQMRLKVLELGAGRYEFIWSHHHILMDGWCISILIDEFYQLFSALQSQLPIHLPSPSPYSTYIRWLDTVDRPASLQYWKEYLQGYAAIAELPFRLSTEAPSATDHLRTQFLIDAPLQSQITMLCRNLEITPNTFFQTTWAYLLARYNNTTDVVFGAVVSGRPAAIKRIEDMVGLFINTIPVRVKVPSEHTIQDLLKAVQADSISGNRHHFLKLPEVQDLSDLGRDLINHIMIFENYPVREMLEQGNRKTQGEPQQELVVENVQAFEQTNYDFNVVVMPAGELTKVEFRYDGNCFKAASIQTIAAHYLRVITQFVASTAQSVTALTLLDQHEREDLLPTDDLPFSRSNTEKHIIDLFKDQVQKHPDKTALKYRAKSLSFKELDDWSDQFAAFLRSKFDIQADDRIGISLERNEKLLVALLGIIKSGGAYVPIDLDYPKARKQYIQEDSSCLLIVDAELLRTFEEERDKYLGASVAYGLLPQQLAYVIYTSGSTGQPKGVMVEHRNVVSFFDQIDRQLGYENASNMASTTKITFDISVLELLGTICLGKEVILFGNEELLDPSLFIQTLIQHEVEVVQLTPSRLKQLEEVLLENSIPSLKHLIVGGEAFPQEWYERLDDFPDWNIVNVYGPTETTIWSSSLVLKNSTSLSIGKALRQEHIYILNEWQDLQPPGVLGEICIAGEGVTRGYLNRRALTEEKFIEHPFSPGERMYRTGDMGKYLPNREIEFIGRKDHQVKIRGHRIELGEIEQALLQFPSVKQAVVLVLTNSRGDKELIAYLVSNTAIDTQEFRKGLLLELPSYMLPSQFIAMEAFPLSVNGKLDRKAFPAPEKMERSSALEYVAPRTEGEEQLVAILADVTAKPKEHISVLDNFFDLGVNSLHILKIIIAINQSFAVDLKVVSLFEYPNISELHAFLSGAVPDQRVEDLDANIAEDLDEAIDLW